jgi:hypothetical protein
VSLPVEGRLEKEFPLMTAMCQMPGLSGDKKAVRTCFWRGFHITLVFRLKM